MATIVRPVLRSAGRGTDPWPSIASTIAQWCEQHAAPVRDTVVLLPFAQLLAPARRAFARRGGWMPRVETTRTLAAGLGPAAPAAPGELSMDPTVDALTAAAMLRSRPWGAEWARSDPRAFDQAVAAVVSTAQAFARAAAAVPPAQRPAHWAGLAAALTPVSGPGATERLLARVALEWASLAPAPASDALFAMAGVRAWVAVRCGGIDALAERLVASAHGPALVVDADAGEGDPLRSFVPDREPVLHRCDSFEDEARCVAAQVTEHLRRGEVPVALIAQDRVLVRRVRALLGRDPLRVVDETGWTLSTTRAAARVMALLGAAAPDARTDALLDWLKSGARWARTDGGAALQALERACRASRIDRVAALDLGLVDPAAQAIWQSARAVLAHLGGVRVRPLARWLGALADALGEGGDGDALRDDDAGRQLIEALRLAPSAPDSAAWDALATRTAMTFDAFVRWVDGVLESAVYLPTPPAGPPQVVVTPLARALMRPWAAVVLAGADDRRLGAAASPASLLAGAPAAAFGLPTPDQQRDAETLAFAHLLAAPGVTFMRRRADGAEPLADSPLIERLAAELARVGRGFAVWQDPRVERTLVATPVSRSAPAAPDLLPARLSATACEALRACPYRFFALQLLRLREDEEIEREIDKRDYGNWLHEVLHEFHRHRGAPGPARAEIERLQAIAARQQDARHLADADFIAFAASFADLAPRYVVWLHDRDRAGARWTDGEAEFVVRPAALGGTALRGIVDRLDDWPGTGGPTLELIDYKTVSAQRLRERIVDPFEDTQLAFYAALLADRHSGPLQAGYLALDRDLQLIAHKDVDASARALVEGLAHDLRRLRAGAGLPALGEGETCEHCAARGLCRRDHWTAAPVDGAE